MKSIFPFLFVALVSLSAFAFSDVLQKNALTPTEDSHFNSSISGKTTSSATQFHTSLEVEKLKAFVFPNPMSSNSLVTYQLAKDSRVVLTLFDCQGRLAGELMNELQEAGSHRFFFERKGLDAGLYFLNIKTDTQNTSISVALVD